MPEDNGNRKRKPTVFIGSSTEGLDWARELQGALTHDCDPQVWTDGIFEEGSTALTSLIEATKSFDFAAFVLTPDDSVTRRGEMSKTPRDNVILELGLFAGSLGAERVLVFRPREEVLALPSDWFGIIDCEFTVETENKRASMSVAAAALRKRVARLGVRMPESGTIPAPAVDANLELVADLNAIRKAALSQGWRMQTWDSSVYRLVKPPNKKFSFPLTDNAVADRERLRSELVPGLTGEGLRLSLRVQAPVGADLATWRPPANPPRRSRKQ